MATYTHGQLEALWVSAGGSAASADVAAAIAQAESGGCQYALAGPVDVRPVKECTFNQTNGEDSHGLWQINLQAHPGLASSDLFDPLTNAQAAVSISGGGASFSAWTTYTNGAYRAYLAGPGDTQPGSGGSGNTGDPGGKTPKLRSIVPANLFYVGNPDFSFDDPPDIYKAWEGFTSALTNGLPHGVNRAAMAAKRLGQAVR